LACFEHDIARRIQAQGLARTQGRTGGVDVACRTGQGDVVAAVDRAAHGRAAVHIARVAAAGETHADFTLDQDAVAGDRLGGAVALGGGGHALHRLKAAVGLARRVDVVDQVDQRGADARKGAHLQVAVRLLPAAGDT
jgi:hypothetical protein